MEKEILRLKFVGALIGTGVGDALGRSMEGLFIRSACSRVGS